MGTGAGGQSHLIPSLGSTLCPPAYPYRGPAAPLGLVLLTFFSTFAFLFSPLDGLCMCLSCV